MEAVQFVSNRLFVIDTTLQPSFDLITRVLTPPYHQFTEHLKTFHSIFFLVVFVVSASLFSFVVSRSFLFFQISFSFFCLVILFVAKYSVMTLLFHSSSRAFLTSCRLPLIYRSFFIFHFSFVLYFFLSFSFSFLWAFTSRKFFYHLSFFSLFSFVFLPDFLLFPFFFSQFWFLAFSYFLLSRLLFLLLSFFSNLAPF